jgi:hypothetical protein
MEKPVGTSEVSPGAIESSRSTAAHTSIPAEPCVAYAGKGTSEKSWFVREILTVICSGKGVSTW